MDSLTHIALGACIGEIMAGRKMGKKALLWGAAAQSLPDIDFIASSWSSPAEDLLAHRGFTHSFLFVLLMASLLALLANKYQKESKQSFRQWVYFFGLQLLVHVLLDALNAYGTGWFEPLNHWRVSCETMFVADPLFTGSLIVSSLVLLGNRKYRYRKQWALGGILISAAYLILAGVNKLSIENTVSRSLKEQHIHSISHFTSPTPFNTWLWYVVAKVDSGYHIGYRSVFDRSPNLKFRYVPRQDSLLQAFNGREDLQQLIRFSKGYYTVQQWGDSLVFNDLRFGQVMGWHNPTARFVFYYYLQYPSANTLLIQRGRMAGWNAEAWKGLFHRIQGD